MKMCRAGTKKKKKEERVEVKRRRERKIVCVWQTGSEIKREKKRGKMKRLVGHVRASVGEDENGRANSNKMTQTEWLYIFLIK